MCRAQVPATTRGRRSRIAATSSSAARATTPGRSSTRDAIVLPPLAGGEQQSGPRPRRGARRRDPRIQVRHADRDVEARAIDKIAGSAMMILGTNTPATSQHVGTSYSEMYQKIAKGEVRDDTPSPSSPASTKSRPRDRLRERGMLAQGASGARRSPTRSRTSARPWTAPHPAVDRIVGQAALFRHSDRRRRLLDQRGGLGGRPGRRRRGGAARPALLAERSISRRRTISPRSPPPGHWMTMGVLWRRPGTGRRRMGSRIGQSRPGAVRPVGRAGRPRPPSPARRSTTRSSRSK
jgi:hypothetical protein